MNLEEFRKALSSDATEENTQLKRQLSDLQTEYHEKLSNRIMPYGGNYCKLPLLFFILILLTWQ